MDVERIFSRGHVILSYLRNRLSVQMVQALLCIDEWIKVGIIKEKHIHDAIKGSKEMEEDDEAMYVEDGWDNIDI